MRREATSADPATEWAIRISVAVVFVLTGLDKFLPTSSTYWIHVFGLIGLGQWFRYFTGIVEILGGLLFLVPIATLGGAGILVVTMLGAMVVQGRRPQASRRQHFPGVVSLRSRARVWEGKKS